MRLHLVDIEPELVRCWQTAFAHFPEVEIICGDILQFAHNALVSPANSYGHMDGGIDRHYINYFGSSVQRQVYHAISKRPEGQLPVGAALLISTGDDRIPHLIVTPTMMMPEPVAAANVYHATVAMLRVAKRHSDRITDIYCPGLATGIGQVGYSDGTHEMADAYRDWVLREGPL